MSNLMDSWRNDQNVALASELWNDAAQIQRALMTVLDASSTGSPRGMSIDVVNTIMNVVQRLYRTARNRGREDRAQAYRQAALEANEEAEVGLVPEEIAAAAADAPAEEFGNETEVEWGDSLSSYSSYEVCEIPDLETARKRYPSLDVSSNLTPWLVRHTAWLIARFHVRGKDGFTPYRLTTGSDYSHPVAMLGKVVLGKVPTPRGKMQRRWIKGVWLDNLDRDDSNVLGTSSGAIAVRSVRRLPKGSQTSQELMNDMKGIPWQPRDGMRHKINRELSQPVALPAPAAAGPTALASEPPEEEHPTLAEDGQNVDQDGLVVQAAAQLEDLLGDQAEDFPAGIPADDDDALSCVPTTPARSEAADPPPAVRPSGQPPPFRGAGWSSTLQNLPDEPMSPSGLGQGGKRVRDDQAALAPGQAEAKQSRQAGVLQHLTNHEIWSHIQEWANSEDNSNPMALQRVANVTDFVDQLLNPEEVTKARKVQLQKLWERGAYKSRFTCADVKARYTAAEEEGLDVFVPTPTPEARNHLEVYALTKGYYARSLDIVAAFLIGADRGASEGKHVYMRAPVEWHDIFLEWLETLSPELNEGLVQGIVQRTFLQVGRKPIRQKDGGIRLQK
ncbi:unnamed protein product [Cladocopium goreaui]|uniref:Retrovirus-related Pol polyprotein from transposon TNT 1-94 n=1 Tax=Cladocopium goreaui TaxID=2562237 RepID=A0A9P1G853_9DINO|nr:unnamed protein product [Cladocopium goreaui]